MMESWRESEQWQKEQVKYESKQRKFKKDTGTDRVYSDSSDRIVELFINSGECLDREWELYIRFF